jgi:HPt (histidine-containing phosphotransfer) domain-containing protein
MRSVREWPGEPAGGKEATDSTGRWSRRTLLKTALRQVMMPMSDTTPTESEPGEKPVDLRRLRQVSEGDFDFGVDLLRLFFRNAFPQTQQLLEASKEGDLERVVDLAHAMKGCALTIGIQPFGELCHMCEMAGRDSKIEEIAVLLEPLQQELRRVERFFLIYSRQDAV